MNIWTANDIPDQHGRIAVVTGANSGLGLVTATELARHGAKVILAVRNTSAGDAAAAAISALIPRAEPEVRKLDLDSLDSIRTFSTQLGSDHPVIDLLINNAGVVKIGPRSTTPDGFEQHFTTNAWAPFALTGLLLAPLSHAAAARVVTVSSITHKPEHLNFEDLTSRNGYSPRHAYGRSKLAGTALALELDRRLRASGSAVISVLAHPGVSHTNLAPRAWESHGPLGAVMSRLMLLQTQPAQQGALPQLYAATAGGVHGGQFFGPDGRGERRGNITEVPASDEAADPAIGSRLWKMAEDATSVTYL